MPKPDPREDPSAARDRAPSPGPGRARKLAFGLATLLLPILGSPVEAGGWDHHRVLLGLVKEVAREKSDPSRCEDWKNEAEAAAQALSDEACASGYSVGRVHGSLLAIRGVLKVGNVMLHRHGCRDEAESTMMKARDILISVAGPCIAAGREANAAKDGIQESITAIGGLTPGVPAGFPDLYPPSGPVPPGPSANHCADESPDENPLYNSAKSWVQTFGGISPRIGTNGGSVSCDPSDPQYIWRAYVTTKTPPNIAGPVELVYCNIDTGAFYQ